MPEECETREEGHQKWHTHSKVEKTSTYQRNKEVIKVESEVQRGSGNELRIRQKDRIQSQ